MTTKQPRSYTIRREGSVPILKGGALKELIEYIALSLVEDPSQVEVSQFKTGGKVHFELRVAKEDMGRVAKAERLPMPSACFCVLQQPLKENRSFWMLQNRADGSID
jgi:hypothetical protein